VDLQCQRPQDYPDPNQVSVADISRKSLHALRIDLVLWLMVDGVKFWNACADELHSDDEEIAPVPSNEDLFYDPQADVDDEVCICAN
jgi:hypothetical protein